MLFGRRKKREVKQHAAEVKPPYTQAFEVKPLQIRQVLARAGGPGLGSSFWYTGGNLQGIINLIQADIQAMEHLLPEEGASRLQYVKFFENRYEQVWELLLDVSPAGWSKLASIGTRGDPRPGNLFPECARQARAMTDTHALFLEQARNRFETDIPSGLDPLEEAEAYYWIAFTLHPRRWAAFMGDEFRRSEPEKEAEAPLKLAVEMLGRHLRTCPQDVQALKRLVTCYRVLGRTDALFRAEIELGKAEAAQKNRGADVPVVEHDRSGISFEMKCRKLLKDMGFVTVMTAATSDGGIDIIATRSEPILSGKYVIQCKDWQDSVGVKTVRELYGVMVSEDANKGILITSSRFTRTALDFAKDKRLELIDGTDLERIVHMFGAGRDI